MSKKKNTLKDLDEFLRQQAASLVSPGKLSDKIEPATQKTERVAPPTTAPQKLTTQAVIDSILDDGDSRDQLCDIILGVSGALKNPSAEDKMLINTALYIKYPDRWKEAIREFWRDRQ